MDDLPKSWKSTSDDTWLSGTGITAVADSDLLPAKFSFLTLTTRHSNAIHYNDSPGFTEKKGIPNALEIEGANTGIAHYFL